MQVTLHDMLPGLFYTHPFSNEYYMKVGPNLYYFSITMKALRPVVIMPQDGLFTKLDTPWT